ncbi:hypothetical protein NDU88_003504 [Pleurodeles waltl]|uniref:Uncharacterized protein n=1 Tax=Pleurodeles waltl TaxID=8319 RepID=A0AAV7UCQ5_PLEWA|nr:hypothetical protein NDU88_003504 [Pleurodeles waltl]
MEDRSRRDNIRLLGIPENEEGTDMQAFLGSTLPKLTSLDFDPPLEFQRAHRVGPKLSDKSSRPQPIIACLLRHNQTRQILQAVQSHRPFRLGQHDIRITADYSKDTNESRKAFLALRPRLHQLEMKYGLFDHARILINVNISGNESDQEVVLDGDVCVIDSNVDEITSGAITEEEFEDALKDNTELPKVIDTLRNGNFIKLEKVWSMVKEELAMDNPMLLRGLQYATIPFP